MISYAQNFEDVLLWRAFGNLPTGMYIDIGAQHSTIDSVSKAFYEHGWRGIHAEPIPLYAQLLRQDRPDERVIEAAVSAQSGVMRFFDIPATGLSTANPEIAERHRAQGWDVQEIVVTTITLDDIFDLVSDGLVHWLKIDVEGHERQVIEGWRSSILPWVVVVESTYPNTQTETHTEWEELLLAKGYLLVHRDGLNRYYVSPAHQQHLAPAFQFGPNVFDGFQLAESNWAVSALRQRHDAQLAQAGEREAALKAELQAVQSEVEQARHEAAEREQALRGAMERALAQAQQEAQAQLQDLLGRERTLTERLLEQQAHLQARECAFTEQLAQLQTEAQARLAQAQQAHAAREDRLHEERATLRQRHDAQLAQAGEREAALKAELQAVQSEVEQARHEAAEREQALRGAMERALAQAQQEAQAQLQDLLGRERTLTERLLEQQAQLHAAALEREQKVSAQQADVAARGEQALRDAAQMHAAREAELLARAEAHIAQTRADAAAHIQTCERLIAHLKAQEGALREELERYAAYAQALAGRIDAMQSTWWWRLSMPWRRAPNWAAIPSPFLPQSKLSALPGEPALAAATPQSAQAASSPLPLRTPLLPTVTNNLVSLKQESPMLPIQHITELFALDGRAFVTEAYRNLLGREPDEHGLVYYLGRLSMGYGKAEVIAQLAQSPECRSHDEIAGLKKLIVNQQRSRHWFWGFFGRRNRSEKILQSGLAGLAHINGCLESLHVAMLTQAQQIGNLAQQVAQLQAAALMLIKNASQDPQPPSENSHATLASSAVLPDWVCNDSLAKVRELIATKSTKT